MRHLDRVRFQDQGAAGVEEGRGFGNNAPDKVKAVFPAVQGKKGFPPHFRGKGRYDRGGDIRRIADDEVETERSGEARYGGFPYAVKEIAFDKADGQFCSRQELSVFPGDGQGFAGDIRGADPEGGPLVFQGDGQGARTGTEVQEGDRRGGGEGGIADSGAGKFVYAAFRGLHQGFGVGPGDQDIGGYDEVQTPEFLAAQNVGHALPGPAAFQGLLKLTVCRIFEGFVPGEDQGGFANIENVRKEKGSVQGRACRTGGFKEGSPPDDSFPDGHTTCSGAKLDLQFKA
jgi:hypothetical protein